MPAPTEPPALAVENLSKHFLVRTGKGFGRGRVRALDSVSVAVGAGEIVGIVGESGCGKSTFARCLVGLEAPTSGRIFITGEEITAAGASDRRRRAQQIQMIFQDPYASLNPRWRVEEVLAEPLRNIGVGSRRRRRELGAAMLEKVGLSAADLEKYPFQFSGGQRQRIGIARALLTNPRILIGDEPVSALDVSVQAQILNLLLDLHAETGLAIVLISHDLELVERVCHHVFVMYMGRIVESGPAKPVFHAPLHPYTQMLHASILARSPRDRKPLKIGDGELPNPLAPPPGCRFQTRCPLVHQRCREVDPPLREIAPGRFSACHLDDTRSEAGNRGAAVGSQEQRAQPPVPPADPAADPPPSPSMATIWA